MLCLLGWNRKSGNCAVTLTVCPTQFFFVIATVMTQNIKVILILEVIFNRGSGANSSMGL